MSFTRVAFAPSRCVGGVGARVWPPPKLTFALSLLKWLRGDLSLITLSFESRRRGKLWGKLKERAVKLSLFPVEYSTYSYVADRKPNRTHISAKSTGCAQIRLRPAICIGLYYGDGWGDQVRYELVLLAGIESKTAPVVTIVASSVTSCTSSMLLPRSQYVIAWICCWPHQVCSPWPVYMVMITPEGKDCVSPFKSKGQTIASLINFYNKFIKSDTDRRQRSEHSMRLTDHRKHQLWNWHCPRSPKLPLTIAHFEWALPCG